MTGHQIEQAWLEYRQHRSEESFALLFHESRALVFTICHAVLGNEEDAEDAMQAAYARLLAETDSPAASAFSSATALISRLTVREADSLRKRRGRRFRREVTMNEFPEHLHDEGATRAHAEAHELRARLEAAVATLPDKFRIPVELHYFHGMTHEQVAQALGRPRITITRRIGRALEKLQPVTRRMGLGDALKAFAGIAATAALIQPTSTVQAATLYKLIGANQIAHSSAVIGGATLGAGGTAKAVIAVAAIVALLIIIGGGAAVGLFGKSAKAGGATALSSNALAANTEETEKSGSNGPPRGEINAFRDATSSESPSASAEHESISASNIDMAAEEPRITVEGFVRGECGFALAGAIVEGIVLEGDGGWMTGEKLHSTVKTNSRGYYTLMLPRTNLLVQARHEGYTLDGERPMPLMGADSKEYINFRLKRAVPTKGFLASPDGKAVADAIVSISRLGVSASEPDRVNDAIAMQTRTNENGKFAFEHLAEGRYVIAAEHLDYTPVLCEVELPVDEILLQFEPGGAAIHGTVYSLATNQRIEGSVVSAQGFGGSQQGPRFLYYPRTVASDANGSFRFPHLLPGEYRLSAAKDDLRMHHSSEHGDDLNIKRENEIVQHDLYLFSGYTVHGHVSDKDSGQPIAGVRVSTNPRGSATRTTAVTTTDENGEYTLEHIFAPYIDLEVEKKGYVLANSALLSRPLEVRIEGSAVDTTHDILMEHGIPIAGRVLFDDDTPVANATVAWSSGSGFPADRGKTNSDGSFVFFAAPREAGQITIYGDSIYRRQFDQIDTADSESRNLLLRMDRPARLSGVVVDNQENSATGALVTAKSGSYGYGKAKSGLDGSFEILYIAPGEVTLSAILKNNRAANVLLKIKPGEIASNLKLVLQPPTTIEGIVTDLEGNPVKIHVTARANKIGGFISAQTDRDGRFVLENLMDEYYSLTIGSDKYLTEVRKNVPAGAKDIAIQLRPRDKVLFTGEIVDSRTGKPVGNAIAQENEISSLTSKYPVQGNRVEIEVSAGTDLYLVVYAPGYAVRDVKIVAPTDRDKFEQTIALDPAPGASGRIVDKHTKAPVEGVLVRRHSSFFSREYHGPEVESITNAEGKFSFKEIRPGQQSIIITPPSPYLNKFTDIRQHGNESHVEAGVIELDVPRDVVVRLIPESGTPRIGGIEVVLDMPREIRAAKTDAHGVARFENISAEDVRAWVPEYSRWGNESSSDATKEFIVPIGGGSLRARALFRGKPIAVRYSLTHELSRTQIAARHTKLATGSDKTIRADYLAPGEWQIQLDGEKGGSISGEFTIAGVATVEREFEFPPYRLLINVKNAAGIPLESADIGIEQFKSDGSVGYREFYTPQNLLHAGRYRIKVNAGAEGVATRDIELSGTEYDRTIEISTSNENLGTVISYSYELETGLPLTEGGLAAHNQTTHEAKSWRDNQGRGELGNLPFGAYEITVSSSFHSNARHTVNITSADPVYIESVLHRTGTLRVLVLRDGKAVEGADIEITPVDSASLEETRTAKSRQWGWTIHDLRPGQYKIEAEHGATRAAASATVKEREEQKVEIQLE